MSFSSGLAIYFVIWWTIIFAVLPWGLRTQEESGRVVPGTPESAPFRLRLMRIVIVNSVVAGVLFGAFYWLMQSGYKLADFPFLKVPGT
ncbi:DUF1467 family protein [Segnochrobactrum spirostomi]|uniref:DUF1467 family protein n=1 Tax=Segnochrobactrum spirostomi TaxID=2608987 RepID=A0A6A7Y1L5_9HYPH|nr:DUF1467 family protein [Segnochrobactrum spirostomi]MQT12278.1 DUF1467 family protein [Segnochrobactrum spirostomi]